MAESTSMHTPASSDADIAAYDLCRQHAQALKKNGTDDERAACENEAAAILARLQARAASTEADRPTAEALLFVAEHQWNLEGDTPDVEEKLIRATQIAQTLGDEDLLARALEQQGEFHFLGVRFEQARSFYEAALARKPRAKSLAGLAQTLAHLGHTVAADPYFARALDVVSEVQVRYFLLIARAEGLEKLQRSAEAVVLRQQAQALLPKANPGEFGFWAPAPGPVNIS